MLSLCLVLVVLSASVFSESVRETETWMPMKTTQTSSMLSHRDVLESSGDAANGSDFGFTDDEDEDDGDDGYDDYYPDPEDEDQDDYDGFSGSGDGATIVSPGGGSAPTTKPDANDNKIVEAERPEQPDVNEVEIVQSSNEIPLVRKSDAEEQPSNVLMSHAGDESIFYQTEVLAALIAGVAVGLLFAVLLILLLIYRMKKKDEGSYDLGKKPIYKKAPTTEIYA